MKQTTPIWLYASVALTAASLAACNSSSSSPGATQDDNQDDTDTGVAYSGKVADGYIVGATVCLDINLNGQCDSDEPSAMSTGGGNYTLELDEQQAEQYPIVVEVGNSAYDEDTGQTFNGPFRLSAPAGSGGFVSPLTTLVASRMAVNPQLTAEQAEASVLEAMGYGSGTGISLFEDYIERNDETDYQVQHRVAQGLTQLFVAAETKQAELEASGDLSEYSPAQAQQAIADFVAESLGEITAVASGSDATDSVVESWLARIEDEVDSDLVASRVSKAELEADSTEIDLMSFIEAEQENSFFFREDYLLTWTSELINDSELVYTDGEYDANVDDFVSGNPTGTRLLLSGTGELIRSESFTDLVSMVDDFPEMDGVQLLTYLEGSNGSLHRLEELLLQGRSVPIGGQNVRQVLSAVHPAGSIQPKHKTLFDADATFSVDAQAVMVERRPIGELIWTLNYHTNCSDERLAEIGEVDEPDLMDNCSIAWLHGIDWQAMSSNSLSDVVNSSAYLPDSDPVQNYENLKEGVSEQVMVDMGEHRGISFTDFDGSAYATVMAELVGSLSDQTGAVNWYVKQHPLTRFIESDTDCQGWADLWAQVNGNCVLPDYLEIPLDDSGVLSVPSELSDVLVATPTLAVGDRIASQLLNNLGRQQAILGVMEYREGELYEGIEGTDEYSVHLAGEFLGADGDENGTLALYEVTEGDTVGFSYWACGSDDGRGDIEALSGNCAAANGFDYSGLFSLIDQMVSVEPDLTEWTPSITFEGSPYYDFGSLNLLVAADEACDMNSNRQPFRGVMIGSPDQSSGTFLVFEQGYFESNECNESVRELTTLNWTRLTDEAGSLYYEIDINPLIDTGLVSSFHGDWDDLNPGYIYLSRDGEVLRHAQLRIRDYIVERIPESGTWFKESIEDRETIRFEIPDELKTEDWHREEFSLVVDNGIVRPWELDEQGQIESLNVSSEWNLHTLGDERVIEIARPDILGAHMWGQGITDVGTRIRRVQSPLGWLANENRSFEQRTWYSGDALEQIQSQVRSNYSTWAAEP